jgi:peptide/nickel transport system substrate-binding protein
VGDRPRFQEDEARPIISHDLGATCWQPHVKGLTMMVNIIYNGWRFEDLWFDKWPHASLGPEAP